MPRGDNNRKLSDEQMKEIARLYTTPNPDGTWMGTKAIGRLFGTCDANLRRRLRRMGVHVRNNKEASANGKRCTPIKNLPHGEPPLCKCGCGQRTEWFQRESRWYSFVRGHYHPPKPYHSREWLFEEYVNQRRTMADIASQFHIAEESIRYFIQKMDIPIRPQSESLNLSGAVRGSRNPAWKGGIAKWKYSYDWKHIARQIRKRDNYTCQHCGKVAHKNSRAIHVHHIDRDKTNNDPANLITLCVKCHMRADIEAKRAA